MNVGMNIHVQASLMCTHGTGALIHSMRGRYSKEPEKEEGSAHKSMAEQEEALKNLTMVLDLENTLEQNV